MIRTMIRTDCLARRMMLRRLTGLALLLAAVFVANRWNALMLLRHALL